MTGPIGVPWRGRGGSYGQGWVVTKQGATASCRFSRTGHFFAENSTDWLWQEFWWVLCYTLSAYFKKKKHLPQVSFQREMWGKTCRTAKVANFCPSLPLTKGPKVDFLPTLTGSIWGLHFTAVSHLVIFDILTRRRSKFLQENKSLFGREGVVASLS